VNLILIVGFIGHIKRDQGWLPFSRLLVASRPALDLLPCAKHLFIAAILVVIAPAAAPN
jgi:hypothetical protein